MEIGLVSCTSKKATAPKPPKELYMESVLFEKARRYCEQFHDKWYILSAKHGLLEPDGEPIEPYDVSLSGFDAARRRTWGKNVASEIQNRDLSDSTLVIHAGKDYYEPLIAALDGGDYKIPTEGLRYGESLSWYNNYLQG